MIDKEFLTQLCTQQHQTRYVRITALDMNDMPLQNFVGHITNGDSISLDGQSALRRTCSFGMIVNVEDKEEFTSYNWSYWGLSHKFKLEVGLLNNINNSYPSIVWFNQGVFFISNFSYTLEGDSAIKINISGKDKMAKLNGDLGGVFPTQITLDTIEVVNKDGSVTYEKQHIYDIIRRVVHEIGGEPEHNIVVEDLPAYGYELWNYLGSNHVGDQMPLYLLRYSDEKSNNYNRIMNMTLDGNKMVYHLYNEATTQKWDVKYDFATSFVEIYDDSGAYNMKMTQSYAYKLKEIIESELYHSVDDSFETGEPFTLVENENATKYKIQKINSGDIAGYHQTALIYPQELIMAAGESVTSALDKIRDLLGNFEYFYDVDGRFVFRKQKNYINELFSPINGDIIEPFMTISPYSYEFNDKTLLQSLSPSPAIDKVKNDFIIWGNKNGINSQPAIHARYAISKKPESYKTFPYYKKAYDRTYVIPHMLYQQVDENCNLILSSEKFDKDGYVTNWESISTTPLPGTGYFIVYGKEQKRKKINKPQNCCESEYVIDLNENKQPYYRKASYTELQDELCLKYYLEMTPIRPDGGDTTLYAYDADTNDLTEEKYSDIKYQNIKYFKKDNNKFVELDDNEYIKEEDAATKKFIIKPNNLDEVYYLKEGPTLYHAFDDKGDKKVDWRELLYLMARDYYQHNQDPDYVLNLMKNNPWTVEKRATGYENFYADMQAFWRDLYDPEGKSPKYIKEGDKEGKYKNWSRTVLYYPETLNFWIDFLDCGEGTQIDAYSIQKIGFRTHVEKGNSSGISAIFYKNIPDIQFVLLPTDDKYKGELAYQTMYIQDSLKQLFTISSKGIASNEKAKELIWRNTCIAENVNITCIPLYFLEPNTRIKLLGEDYLINNIQLPMGAMDSLMTISASKIIRPF